MPYSSNSELPDNVQGVLPEHAQDIYLAAYNNAYAQYKDPEDRREGSDREEVSHRVAWSAVGRKYQKSDDGHWRAID